MSIAKRRANHEQFVLGINLGKSFCSLVGLDEEGAVVLRRTIRRSGLLKTIEKLEPEVAAMEACCGAHFFGRQCQALGIEVRLMSSVYVKPYVKTNKSDDRDAEAIAEAATRPTLRFVPLKSQEPLDLQSVHPALDQVTAAKLAVDCQIEQRSVPNGSLAIEEKANCSDLLLGERTLGADLLSGVSSRSLADSIIN